MTSTLFGYCQPPFIQDCLLHHQDADNYLSILGRYAIDDGTRDFSEAHAQVSALATGKKGVGSIVSLKSAAPKGSSAGTAAKRKGDDDGGEQKKKKTRRGGGNVKAR